MIPDHYAIFFADIAGSSSLYKQIGDERAKEAMSTCLAQMTRAVERHGGTVIKTIGDELMARFNEAHDATRAARAIQQERNEANSGALARLEVKIGINYGPAILEKGDVFGDTVNTAARMVSAANPEQIVVTQETVDALPPLDRDHALAFDYVKIKAFDKDIPLYLINWRDYDSKTVTVLGPGVRTLQRDAQAARLTLRYQGREEVLTPDTPSFTLGRDESMCKLAVAAQFASRKHAWIEFRRGKYVLVDHSSNGTWVTTADNKEIYLRREELPLWGSGKISLGIRADDDPDNIIAFSL